ncbi:ABC transporter permease [Fulvivirgaceae bacterium BMA12]|uniref:ABC transporter permease n=1 Tax=Agaribacillus aureus TaxID=3051825 RepID=A0ABT8LFW3_9BACT|nr:ABC transporter permease [Fulvivirgaceae bacterium BMA12]
MFKNLLIIALRNLWYQKLSTAINIIGLTLGLVCSLLILLWVDDELSINQFHDGNGRVFQVLTNNSYKGEISTHYTVPRPLEEVIKNNYPEIEKTVLIGGGRSTITLLAGENVFKESGLLAGEAFFEIFSFPLLAGNATSILSDITNIAISDKLAEKYFGPDLVAAGEVLGKTITIDRNQEFTVSGIFKVPSNSSLQFDFVLPVAFNTWDTVWGNYNFSLFVRLKKQADPEEVNSKIANVLNENSDALKQYPGLSTELFLFPFSKMYLYAEFENGKPAGGKIEYVRVFSMVAMFVLILACINFMNLATARSTRRAREIGIRKVVGASKYALVRQFLGESFLITFISIGLAVLMVHGVLPVFNNLTDKTLTVDYSEPVVLIGIAGIFILTGLAAGMYPAFFLSSFKTVNVFKGDRIRFSYKWANLRKGLVVFQFALSIVMIIGTFIIRLQIDYLQHKNLGLDKENVIYLVKYSINEGQFEMFKHELMGRPGIENVSFVSCNPLHVWRSSSSPTWDMKDPEKIASFQIMTADHDLLDVMKIPLSRGRNFSKELAADTMNFLINETAAKSIGLKDPLNADLELWGQKGQIIGVVKDFHTHSLRSNIQSLIIRYRPEAMRGILIRAKEGETKKAMATLKQLHKRYQPDFPFDYFFLDQRYQASYKHEMMIGKLADLFSLLAIVIACLGLLGLISYSVIQRTKEIGIRKVFGATVANILLLFSRDYLKLVLIAFVIAVPVANYFITEWLMGFAYKVSIQWWFYAIPGFIIFCLAILIVSGQSLKVATGNPADSLRSE